MCPLFVLNCGSCQFGSLKQLELEKESYAVLYVLKMKNLKTETTTASKLGANLDPEIKMFLVRSAFKKIRISCN